MRARLFILCTSLWAVATPSPSQESSPLPSLVQDAPRGVEGLLVSQQAYDLGPVVPGLRQGAVPQGMAYSRQRDAIIISHYFENDFPSCISVIDNATGRLAGTYALKQSDS